MVRYKVLMQLIHATFQFFKKRGATAAALTSNTQNEKITQQLIREEEEAMAKYKVSKC